MCRGRTIPTCLLGAYFPQCPVVPQGRPGFLPDESRDELASLVRLAPRHSPKRPFCLAPFCRTKVGHRRCHGRTTLALPATIHLQPVTEPTTHRHGGHMVAGKSIRLSDLKAHCVPAVAFIAAWKSLTHIDHVCGACRRVISANLTSTA